VCAPAPAGSVYALLAEKGTHAPKVLPSLEKRMSSTGSPELGLDADRFSVTLCEPVVVAPR
jgi:hypothetical protein